MANKTITLVDNGDERYLIKADFTTLGRRYDNESEELTVIFPEFEREAEHACTMVVTHDNQNVDRILVTDNTPVAITSRLSQYTSVTIGFVFTDSNGYIKGSEKKLFPFLPAQSPEDFVPVDPEIEDDLLFVIANALTKLGLSGNTLQGKNKSETVTTSVDLTAFKNTNIKFNDQVVEEVDANDFAAGIEMSLDTTNYKLTVNLVDGNDVVLSTQTVDLPSENAIVDASYDETTKKITFVLQSGNTFDVDVSSIVSGLVSDSRTIAGLRLNADISASALRTALNVDDGADSFNEDNIIAGDNVTITKSGKNVTISSTGGGGGGTSDYADLENKPSINSVTLSGNKTSSDLGLQPTIDSSHKLSADLVQDGTTNKVYTATEQTKLSGIEDGAEVNDVNSVNSKTGTVVLDADDISDSTTTNKFVTASDKTTWSGKQDTSDNSLTTTSKNLVSAINEVNSIAKGANQSLSYTNYSAMITAFNALSADAYNVGQNIFIVTLEVPDLWISSIESTSVAYTYTTDSAFTTALATDGYVQVGYYKLSALENQKIDLTGYVQKTTTIAGVDLQDNITKSELLTALNVADGAEVNVQANWSQTDTTADDYIQNKPTIPTVNDATVTITTDGNTLGSFTVNQSNNSTIDLGIRYGLLRWDE